MITAQNLTKTFDKFTALENLKQPLNTERLHIRSGTGQTARENPPFCV